MATKVTVDAGRQFDVDIVTVDMASKEEIGTVRVPRDHRVSVVVHTGQAIMVRDITAQDITREIKAAKKKAD